MTSGWQQERALLFLRERDSSPIPWSSPSHEPQPHPLKEKLSQLSMGSRCALISCMLYEHIGQRGKLREAERFPPSSEIDAGSFTDRFKLLITYRL